MTVPNGLNQSATFNISSQTSLDITATTKIGSVIFNANASPFAISVDPMVTLTIGGPGIQNASQVNQTFTLIPGPFGSASGVLHFVGAANAGTSVINTLGGRVNFDSGAFTIFSGNSSAGNSTLLTTGALAEGSSGTLIFTDNSTAANSTITTTGGKNPDFGSGATTAFAGNSTAEDAIITVDAGEVFTAFGGVIQFNEASSAGASTLIADGGIGFPGGITFYATSNGGTARVEIFDSAYLAIDPHDPPGVTVGSIEGNGAVALGANTLTVGSTDLSTIFSGNIDDQGAGGSLTKIGAGTLALTGANTYSGVTTIDSGVLLVNTRTGSGTGPGPVLVNAGTLGGMGIIGGSVTLGTGSGLGAVLAPGSRRVAITKLEIQGPVFFKADGIYASRIDPVRVAADQVTADGTTIADGAQVRLNFRAGAIAPGVVFVLINNTSTVPITGVFSNLGDGMVFAHRGTKFQVSYKGGDGNDLTLTAIQ